MVGDLIREDALEEIKELEKKAEAYEQGTGERLDSLETQAQVFLGLDMERDVKNYFGMFGVVGTMDEEARRLGRVTVKEGRFPEALGEIAMTEAQILRLGGEARLGEPITVSVCSKDGAAEQKTYRLCGILNTYGGSWQSKGYSLVTAVISDRAADDYSWEPLYDMFMEIDGDPADTIAVYGMESESMETISHFSFNSYGYGFRSKQSLMYLAVAFLVVLLLAALLILQILTVQMRSRSRQVGILNSHRRHRPPGAPPDLLGDHRCVMESTSGRNDPRRRSDGVDLVGKRNRRDQEYAVLAGSVAPCDLFGRCRAYGLCRRHGSGAERKQDSGER